MRLSASILRLPVASVIKDFIILVRSGISEGMGLGQLPGTYNLVCFSHLFSTSPAICNSADDLNEFDRCLSSSGVGEKSSKEFAESMSCCLRREKPERNPVRERHSWSHMLLSKRESTWQQMFTNALTTGEKKLTAALSWSEDTSPEESKLPWSWCWCHHFLYIICLGFLRFS